ncbi:MAG: NAD-dependent epimerase/dehydratase family protein [Candidatus Bipolaricaulota bacterium]|nr:NAD-dependent epimerase/dehydratase family protein [Candidatus Bipolaricaulota bacterium]MDW8030645.1 NAD-dependent epimerase/dehydratase family protein [Candidatus Bipolaricaulota bacterium]
MKTILVTGANGEIGHGLISRLADQSDVRIIALDIHELDPALKPKVHRAVVGDILDAALLESLSATYNFDTIYHLAALLSTKAERQPVLAHKVNVDGTVNLLEMAVGQSRVQGREIKFLYPSSIAVYGLPDLQTKARAGKVKEHEWLTPRTMYGINKLYCEQLGIYYAQYYRQLDADAPRGHIDFRALRFPGLISAVTVPTGGTSDYAPEMLHAAAQGKPYACFVREDTRIPFMAMPDAIEALLTLEAAPRPKLTRFVYNVTAFNPSAREIFELVRRAFPTAQVTFTPDQKRQKIVDSWPADVDDSAARADWGWRPAYDLKRAFDEYLVPGVRRRYRT